jgi:peptide deformylase
MFEDLLADHHKPESAGQEVVKAVTEELGSYKNGLAIAANQVGCCEDSEKEYSPILYNFIILRNGDEFLVFYEPKITRYFGAKYKTQEFCLTWPANSLIAERYYSVDVEYFNSNGELKTETLTGRLAQIWQHEVDHLRGVAEDLRSYHYNFPLPKVGRNDPCPCFSGKKYKHCCLLKNSKKRS